MADLDLVIRGGTIVDGTGSPGVRGDVGVRDGKIVAIGEVKGSAARTIDAEGKVVSPGFVDIHTHYDAQILWDRMLSISPWHGVTSVVMGNCGFGVAPTRKEARGLILRTLEKVEGMSLAALEAGLGEDWGFETFPEYLDAVEKRGSAINVGALLGHTPLRLYVMGEEATEREATPAEIETMQAIVRDSMKAGAIGFASSKATTHVGYEGRPVPSRLAHTAEIEKLAGELGKLGQGVVQATFGPGLEIDELATIARSTGRPVTWTALLGSIKGPGTHRPLLEQGAKLHAEGVPVVPQVSCRPLNFEYQWSSPFPFEGLSLFREIAKGGEEGRRRAYRDPAFREAFKERLARRPRDVWGSTIVAEHKPDPSLEERTIAELAAERNVHPIDLVLDLALASNLESRFRVALFNDDEDEVEELLRHPSTILGLSDAGAHASQLCDACFSTHLLSRWVRERKSLSLERAVWMLTDRAASVFGIRGRGRIAQGWAADLVVFDPATIGASRLRRVFDLPGGADRLIAEATGIDAVVVNGTPIREQGRETVDPDGALPGQLLRGGAAV